MAADDHKPLDGIFNDLPEDQRQLLERTLGSLSPEARAELAAKLTANKAETLSLDPSDPDQTHKMTAAERDALIKSELTRFEQEHQAFKRDHKKRMWLEMVGCVLWLAAAVAILVVASIGAKHLWDWVRTLF